MKTGNQKRKYSFNRYEDIDKCIWKVFDSFGHDEKIENLVYWTRKLKRERAAFRKKAVKYDELQSILEKYNVTPEILKEVLLIGQMFRNQSTLDECKKEWEERGWTIISKEQTELYLIKCDHRYSPLYYMSFYIRKEIQFSTNCPIDKELLNLLSKTLKALEVKR